MKKRLVLAAIPAVLAGSAYAQSSVTLYGIVDTGLTYVNHEGSIGSDGRLHNNQSNVGLTSGNIQGSRFGLRGVEDLGGGLKAIFTLESGFNLDNGAQDESGRMFNRQSFVGLASNDFGAVTMGRQYDSEVDYLGPLSAAGTWGGTYFAHYGDLDNLDNSVRTNNSVKFQSANYSGFSFSGLYGFSNDAGAFASNRSYSVGTGYDNGALKLAAAYTQNQGLNSGNGNGAIQATNVIAAASQMQRTWGVGGSYAMGPAVFGSVFTQSRYQFAAGDASDRFNNIEVNARYFATPSLALGAAYTYTWAKRSTTGTDSASAHWNQLGLQADYSLSKRTDVYAEAVGQLGANGNAGTNTAYIFGTDAPSANRSQIVLSTGLRHRF